MDVRRVRIPHPAPLQNLRCDIDWWRFWCKTHRTMRNQLQNLHSILRLHHGRNKTKTPLHRLQNKTIIMRLHQTKMQKTRKQRIRRLLFWMPIFSVWNTKNNWQHVQEKIWSKPDWKPQLHQKQRYGSLSEKWTRKMEMPNLQRSNICSHKTMPHMQPLTYIFGCRTVFETLKNINHVSYSKKCKQTCKQENRFW